jgi:excinuclease UvrABC nuclease subunit
MITKKTPDGPRLQTVIDALLTRMSELDSHYDQEEYAKMLDQLTKLYKLKETESRERVSKDTLVLVTANLIGIVLILGYEKANVITTKALSFVTRLR